ncbi:CLAVATA3/ESR (CLE)-related protein 9-like [Argentina anserina]|uniref:CLAVATA3/ESR (CLE)-related protein 9-like n=1 Tax=Argentina anserina TaxID=57926 RepID=UPI0021765C3D|nr:CLAVATA3/ESR (CLE)-related protein 9-like [Potentilla anserina]
MKSGLSSSFSSRKLLVALALGTVVLLHLFLPACATGIPTTTAKESTHRRHSCDAISRSSKKLRSMCMELQSVPHSPSPPPSPEDDKIDPRFGVEKRRVPSGPNPLHN